MRSKSKGALHAYKVNDYWKEIIAFLKYVEGYGNRYGVKANETLMQLQNFRSSLSDDKRNFERIHNLTKNISTMSLAEIKGVQKNLTVTQEEIDEYHRSVNNTVLEVKAALKTELDENIAIGSLEGKSISHSMLIHMMPMERTECISPYASAVF